LKRNIIYLLVVVAAVAILLFAGKKFSHPPQDGRLGIVNVAGRTAPDFELQVLGGKGKTMKLSELKGKAVLIDFWATWCEPCKIEIPWIAELQKKYGPDGFQVIGVAMDDSSEETISAFAKKMGVNYPVLLGTQSVGDLYGGMDGLPVNFFVDRSGKIVDRKLGLTDESKMVEAIKKSLAQGGDASKVVAAVR
jgi:thiol-disulfide isomerase/thioredoxin